MFKSPPTPLFTFLQELNFSVNNGVSPNKAQGRIGAFEHSTGNFVVSGSVNAYFGNVSAIATVRASSRVTLDAHYVKTNAGLSFDMPLVKLSDGRANVEKDAPIFIPLNFRAGAGCPIDPNLDHTLLMVFWDYLPDLADT